jgi:ATP-dependent helicase HrpB
LGHEVRQFIARVNFISVALPELDFPKFSGEALRCCLTRAFHGLTLTKEAQAAELLPSIRQHLDPGQLEWLNDAAPVRVSGPGGNSLKLLYSEESVDETEEIPSPEAQLKLSDCWNLETHPTVADGRVPVRLWLQAPDGKRLDSTLDWKAWKVGAYPRLRATIKAKYPGFLWP